MCVLVCVHHYGINIYTFFSIWLTINLLYNKRISSSGGIDSTLQVKLYTSNEPLNVGDINSAGPGLPDISIYFFVLPNALSATQLYIKREIHTKYVTIHLK